MIFKATPNLFHPSFFLEMTPYKFCILCKWPFTQFPIAKFTTHLIYSRVLLFTAVTSNFNSSPLLHALTKTNQYFENDPQENLVGGLSIVLSPDNVIATSKRCTKILAVIFILKRIIIIKNTIFTNAVSFWTQSHFTTIVRQEIYNAAMMVKSWNNC